VEREDTNTKVVVDSKKETNSESTKDVGLTLSALAVAPVSDITGDREVAQLLKDDGFKVEEHTIKEYSYEIQYYTATLPETK